jgi:hypothetical protein
MSLELKLNDDLNYIIVGNGPSLLEKELGSKIDEFDEVVRFNRFAINGYEKNVGSKVTIWSTFGKGELPKDLEIRPDRIIFTHGEWGCPTYEPKEIIKIPLSFYNNLRTKLKNETKLSKDNLIPSSGILVISWLLENYLTKITITGFDHFFKNKSSLHHYWVNKSFTKPKEHDGDWECSVVENYIKKGKIIKLEDSF